MIGCALEALLVVVLPSDSVCRWCLWKKFGVVRTGVSAGVSVGVIVTTSFGVSGFIGMGDVLGLAFCS